MQTIRLGVLVLGFAIVATRAWADEPNTLTPAEEAAGFKLLFDGKTLDGWRCYKQDTVGPQWQVVLGLLTLNPRPGDLVTVDQYEAFELVLDYKFPLGYGNSGVLFHVTETQKESYLTGPEVQLLDNIARAPQKSGFLYELYSSDVDAMNPPGEWNTLRLIVTPKKSEVYVNGKKYYDFVKGSDDWNDRVAKSKFASMPEFGKPTKGHIVLQSHHDPVMFRNIKIRDLSKQ